jgi:hypothetical protein
MAAEVDYSFSEQCRQVIEELERAAKLHARDIEKEIDQIQRDIARLRDALIDRLRHAKIDSDSGRREAGLDEVNIALSLIVAVEYPVTSIQRSVLDQAAQVLKKVLAEGRFLDLSG